MKVTSVHNILGWFYGNLRVEERKTYQYDKGNDITIVERRSIPFLAYSNTGKLHEDNHVKGSNVDVKV